MKRFVKNLETFAENPYLNVFIGLILFATGFAEAGEAFVEDIVDLRVGAHHGVMLFGFVHAFKSLPAIILGIELFLHGAKEK